MQFFTDVLCNHAISRIINCTIQCWIMLLIIGFPSKNNGNSNENLNFRNKHKYNLIQYNQNLQPNRVSYNFDLNVKLMLIRITNFNLKNYINS